jgi:flavin reductase (DIM6/NTAB) family NADH-FMN oxidoreductase RutF
MQVGFAPPILCVAVGKERAHLAALRSAGRFAVSVLDKPGEKLMGAFFRKYEPGRGPFDELKTSRARGGSTVCDEALAWFECRVTGEHALDDHVVVFGEVTDAKLCREGEPSVHLRKNGLGY